CVYFFFSSRRRHTRFSRDWSSDVCSSDLSSRRNSRMATTPSQAASIVGMMKDSELLPWNRLNFLSTADESMYAALLASSVFNGDSANGQLKSTPPHR